MSEKSRVVPLMSLFIAVSQVSFVALVFFFDRNATYKAPVYQNTIATLENVIVSAHSACDEIGYTIRLLQRKPSLLDPSRVEFAWDNVVASGSRLSLTADDDLLTAFDVLYKSLKSQKDEFIAWKRKHVIETYEQANSHATKFQEDCTLPVQTFIHSARSYEGFRATSAEISTKLRDNLTKAFGDGGDGGDW